MLCDLFIDSLQYQENLLAKYYVKNGHDVVVIASTFNNTFDFFANKYNKNIPASSYDFNGIKIVKQPYSINIYNRLRKLKNVAKILQEEKPDLIFAHDIYLDLTEAARYVKNNPECRLIMDYHADYSNSAKNWLSLNILHKIIRKYILYKAKPYISKIFPVVPESAKFLNEVYGIPHSEMELLILGSDTDLADEMKTTGQASKIRDQYNISKHDIVIFTGGKITPFKRTDLVIEAFLKIPNQNVHLFIVGDTSEENKTYKNHLLDISNGNDRIHFTGWLNTFDIYKYMSACDIAVFPKSQSVLWQQAISSGLALIVGLVLGNNVSYLNKYKCIIELKENEITSGIIVEKIAALLNNRDLLKEIQESALKTSNELLNYDKIVIQTLS